MDRPELIVISELGTIPVFSAKQSDMRDLGSARHESSVLIFDELNYGLLLKNRRWPSGI